jgi:hypothetical protein
MVGERKKSKVCRDDLQVMPTEAVSRIAMGAKR